MSGIVAQLQEREDLTFYKVNDPIVLTRLPRGLVAPCPIMLRRR